MKSRTWLFDKMQAQTPPFSRQENHKGLGFRVDYGSAQKTELSLGQTPFTGDIGDGPCGR